MSVLSLEHYRPKNNGNGAREAVARYFKVRKKDIIAVDHFLAALWVKGFKIVPLADGRPNPLQEAWDKAMPERIARHKAAVAQLGRKP